MISLYTYFGNSVVVTIINNKHQTNNIKHISQSSCMYMSFDFDIALIQILKLFSLFFFL